MREKMAMPPTIQKFLDDLDKKLHEDNSVTRVLAQIEAKTNVKRVHIVLGFMLVHAVYLIFGHFAELLCNVIGFLYPAYVSIKAVESSPKDDDTQWLTYWIIFALFNLVEFFSSTITKYFPIYWLVKCAFLLWLYLPMTLGAQKLYYNFVRPFVLKHQGSIDKHIGGASDRLAEGIETARREFEQHVKPN